MTPKIRLETSRINKTITELNHLARRKARRERKAGLHPNQREFHDRPLWQRKVPYEWDPANPGLAHLLIQLMISPLA